jgi:hypothetical protein
MKEINLKKKMKGLQTARQYELTKSKKQKRALDKIEEFVTNYRMIRVDNYSDEVIEIKLKVMDILKELE